jgi:hypothetical protein
MSDEPDVVTRPIRNYSKKSNWEKSDKLIHGKKTARKRQLAEVEEDDEDWKDYETR